MVMAYYVTIFILSLICCVFYYIKKRDYYSVNYTLIFILAIMSQGSYIIIALSRNAREALVANKILYIGGCYLILIGLFLIFSVCKIKIPKWLKFLLFMFASFVYACVLTTGYSDLFYKSFDIRIENGVAVMVKEYGPLHNIFLAEIAIFLVMTFAALIYGWFKNPNVSRINLAIGGFMQVFSIFAYFIGRSITTEIEWMALADLVDEIGFLIIMDRISLYKVDDLVSTSILNEGHTGYISLDFKKRYLSATDIAKKYFPEMSKNLADKQIEDEKIRALFDAWIDEFEVDKVSKTHNYRRGEFIYAIKVAYLYDGKRKRGYLLEVADDTAHQQHLEGIERYNQNLNRELQVKTKLIEELQFKNKVIDKLDDKLDDLL